MLNTQMFGRTTSERDSKVEATPDLKPKKKSSKKKKKNSKKKKRKEPKLKKASSSSSSSSSSPSSDDSDYSESSTSTPSSSSPSSSTASSSSEDKSKKKKNKRVSILLPPSERHRNGSDKKKRSSRVQVRMHADMPSYAHIRLESLSLNSIFKFWNEINKYSEKYEIDLKAPLLVSDDIRPIIMARNGMVNDLEFYQLSHKDLARMIQLSVRPTTKTDFSTILKASLQWSDPNSASHPFSVLSYQHFYTRLLALKKEFDEKYEFLAFENKDNVPKIENKDDGSIKIFLDVIPDDYGRTLFKNLDTTKYTSLRRFFKDFFRRARRHYKISLKTQELNAYVPHRSVAPTSAAKTETQTSTLSIRKPFYRRRLDRMEDLPPEDLGNSAEVWEQVDDFQESPPLGPIPESAHAEYAASRSTEQPGTSSLHAFGGGTIRSPPAPPRPPPRPTSASQTGSNSAGKPPDIPKGPNGCFRALIDGTCAKPECTFDHSVAAGLDATREDVLNKMAKRRYAARTPHDTSLAHYALDPPTSGKF